jgi:hypothetical protein
MDERSFSQEISNDHALSIPRRGNRVLAYLFTHGRRTRRSVLDLHHCENVWKIGLDRFGQTNQESVMNSQGIFGGVLLVVGVALLIVGMNSSHSVADQVSNTFSGRFTQDTMWYIIGGIAAGVLGLLMLLFGMRGKHS